VGKGKLYKRGRVQTIFTALFAIAITFTPAAFAQTDITSEFTDQNFRNKVCTAISKSAECTILNTDVQAITILSVQNSNIASLAGIEYFTALTTLNAYSNQLTELDVSNNTALTSLNVRQSQLTEIDVSNNTALTTLNVQNNQFTEIDVSNNTALTTLNAYSNQLTALDVSKNTALTWLGVYDNQLTTLNVSKNTALIWLDVSSNQLTEIDVSNNTALTRLDVSNNQLTEIDVSNNTALTTLNAYNNQLTEIDLSNNTALTRLGVGGNQLTSLDVSNNTSLQTLYISNNKLTSLDLSNNTELYNLDVSNNKLTEIDVSNNTELWELNVSNNKLTSLDVSGLDNLSDSYFDCSYNYLKEVIGWDGDIGEQNEPYTVTVIGGTGSGEYAEDVTITITATVPSGKKFKNWTATGATLSNANSATTTFKMPATAVTITAVFEDEDDGTDPVRKPQLASNNISVHAIGKSIVLQNLPANAKVEVFGLNGKLITTSHSPLATSHLGSDMSISVQTKGMYIVKISSGSVKQVLRVAVK
jgi:Leucine-rich repeat (LRR) protein